MDLASESAGRGGLEVRDLSVSYGSARVVNNLSFKAPRGEVTSLIGPNGAGKTTTFNACCGLVGIDNGTIRLGGKEITTLSTARRARLGLGRTFQQMELFEGLTVRENLEFGVEARTMGGNPVRHLVSSRGARAWRAQPAKESASRCGIRDLLDRPAGSLSTGQRRLTELARCIAGGFEIVLLDEPSSGLSFRESKSFVDLLMQLAREQGLGVLLVEHNMSVVLGASDYVYVMDFGELIFSGTPGEVVESSIVREAYLGSYEDTSGSAVNHS